MKTQLCALILGALVTQAALADDPDPPALVGRISFVQGHAGLQAGDTPAEQVQVNRPVTIGDRVRTDSQSLLEISLGTAAVRMDQNTDVTVANLDEGITQLQLDGGALSLHVFELDRNENVEIDTPTATVRLREAGDYRIDTNDDGMTRVAVRHGDAEIDGGGRPIHVRDQQQLVFEGSDEPAQVIALTTPDDFDQWSMARDRHFENQRSTQYVSREVVGYEDLDANGNWDEIPEYGAVWYPSNVPADWAPYRDGRWVWVSPWGWSWVDDEPWGFAPFHYGRWAYVGRRWCWVPGPRHVRPVYAPALVAWNGGGVGVSVGFSISNRPSRWFPLGPREVYVPAHRASTRYLHNVNISNTVIVNNEVITNAYRGRARDVRYINRDAPNAITTRETLARVSRPPVQFRPLPPRPAFSRGVAEREGVPVAVRPPRPVVALRNDRRDDSRRFDSRGGDSGRRFDSRTDDGRRFDGRAGGQDRDRRGFEERPGAQAVPMQPRPQFQQRAQINERLQEQERRQQLQIREQEGQRAQVQREAAQRDAAQRDAAQRDAVERAQLQRQELLERQQQGQRQPQLRQELGARQRAEFQAQQAARESEAREQQAREQQRQFQSQREQQAQFQAQREQQMRQQQAQFQAQREQQAQFQAQREQQMRQQQQAQFQAQREQQMRQQQQAQFQVQREQQMRQQQAQQAQRPQRPSREETPRGAERRGSGRESAERQQLR